MSDYSKDMMEVKTSLARIEENLKEHMRRTHNLEGRAESIEKHVHMVQGVFGFLGILALIATVGAFVATLF